jgi:predicted transcriptional regulator
MKTQLNCNQISLLIAIFVKGYNLSEKHITTDQDIRLLEERNWIVFVSDANGGYQLTEKGAKYIEIIKTITAL